jgi:hypothetical protein
MMDWERVLNEVAVTYYKILFEEYLLLGYDAV